MRHDGNFSIAWSCHEARHPPIAANFRNITFFGIFAAPPAARIRVAVDALAVDDADRAFSFAAPGIREMMGNAQNFLAMVRTGYPVVHRPASVAFLKAELKGAEVIQAVQMTDAKGVAWLAVYNLQRQSDKSWRISGCVVVPNEGRAV